MMLALKVLKAVVVVEDSEVYDLEVGAVVHRDCDQIADYPAMGHILAGFD